MKQNMIPAIELIANGAVENATIPSSAYMNNFQKDHFVSPATLSSLCKPEPFQTPKPRHTLSFLNRIYGSELKNFL